MKKDWDIKEIRKQIDYDPITGKFTRKKDGSDAISTRESFSGAKKNVISICSRDFSPTSIAMYLQKGISPSEAAHRARKIDREKGYEWDNLEFIDKAVKDQNKGEAQLLREFPNIDFNEMFDYYPETGKIYWKSREVVNSGDKTFNTQFSGKEAGSVRREGYMEVRVKRDYRVLVHRIIWHILHGEFPQEGYHIDHIDQDRTNNRASNLRCVHGSDNARNCPKKSNNTSGHTGVRSRNIRGKIKWEARIYTNGKEWYLGRYDNIEDAVKARRDAEIKYGFYKNHGKEGRQYAKDS